MAKDVPFIFRRARGIVWVCDIADSTKYLNDDETVAAIEEFLPRFYWLARVMVRAAGGEFIKWTGDGFLAWFETPLYREMPARVRSLLYIISHITIFTNVTNLGVTTPKKFKMRHGVTYEQDALMTTLTHASGQESTDIIGRAVVLAFRLSGRPAHFPGVVTQREVIKGKDSIPYPISFVPWRPTAEERLKYFKGEKWGINNLCVSEKRKPPNASLRTMVRRLKQRIAKAETPGLVEDAGYQRKIVEHFIRDILDGPDWARAALMEYGRFAKEDLLGSAKNLVKIVEEAGLSTIEGRPNQETS
jgi:class 3 adenylate cyclase